MGTRAQSSSGREKLRIEPLAPCDDGRKNGSLLDDRVSGLLLLSTGRDDDPVHRRFEGAARPELERVADVYNDSTGNGADVFPDVVLQDLKASDLKR